jgi:hypothetical protein
MRCGLHASMGYQSLIYADEHMHKLQATNVYQTSSRFGV